MNVPDAIRWRRVTPGSEPAPAEPLHLLRKAVFGHRALKEFIERAAKEDQTILLLVNDGYRSTQTRPALAALADLATRQATMPRFRALVATGTHRISQQEQRALEAATFQGCGLHLDDMAWHDADDSEQLVNVSGIEVHPWIAESRFLLPIGSVEPHYFAGLTGPHKTATVGVLSRRAIEKNHEGAVQEAAGVFRLRGNPVFDGIAEILRALQHAGKTFIAIAEVVRGEEVIAVSIGDPLETVFDLQHVVRRVFTYPLERTVDVLRLRVPPPLGLSFYQADKAIRNNHSAVRDGGGILLEAPCPEGVGQDAFVSLLRRASDHAEALHIIARQGYRLGDHKAVNLRHLTDPTKRGIHLAIVDSHVSEPDAKVLGIQRFAATAPALEWLASVVSGTIEHGLVIEDAGHLCPAPPFSTATVRERPEPAGP